MAESETTPTATKKTIATKSGAGAGGIRFIGLDLGTNTSCILTGSAGSTDIDESKIIPTIVGYVPDDIVDGILPAGSDVFFGDEAMRHELHLRIVAPVKAGIVHDLESTRLFVRHCKEQVGLTGKEDLRAVIGVPAKASETAKNDMRETLVGEFSRVLLVPEPFLAALGLREDGRLGQSNYVDPVQNSLIVDIGAGTSDLCLVQGRFPSVNDQISFNFAGDAIDDIILERVTKIYPDFDLDTYRVRDMKEQHSYTGEEKKVIDVEIVVGGKGRSVEIGAAVRDACNELVERIFAGVKQLISRAPSKSTEHLLKNIILTGGGSMIKGIDTRLEQMLVKEDYKAPKVKCVGPDYKRLVAIGALKAARAAREDQWQISLK